MSKKDTGYAATHMIAQVEDKYCIFVLAPNARYVFRYAYPTMSEAQTVLVNLRKGFGEPAGVKTDLASNYWKLKYMSIDRNAPFLEFVKRTTQKNSWYITQPVYGP